MKVFFLFFEAFLWTILGFSQNSNYPKWNGYIQTRFTSDFDKSSEFIIRRAKLWIYGEVPKADYISYKIQMNYRSYKDETPILQDAYADIRFKNYGMLRVGRFVPDFMLQRMQPDYEIPVLERALVVNSFVHNEKQMAREMGLSYVFERDSLPFHFSFGLFNANVDKPTHSIDNYFLYTSRLTYQFIPTSDLKLHIGGSAAYRHLNKTTLTTIYGANSFISGSDVRWGVEFQFLFKHVKLQSEYLEAKINDDIAHGYYLLADYTFYQKYQAVLFIEKYIDLNVTTNDNPWYGVGFNYQISEKTKLMAEIKTQKSAAKQNYLGEIQWQVFFN